jgi:branched-chain amino acid aminotransferase
MNKDSIAGDFYISEDRIRESTEINFKFDFSEYQLYEVMRTAHGKALFESDHFERLEYGAVNKGYKKLFNRLEATAVLHQLISANKQRAGNIKLYCGFSNESLDLAACYIPHYYPDDALYRSGVIMKSIGIERSDPNLKQLIVNTSIRARILNSGCNTFYETVLVNNSGEITEGSRSNIFMIKNDSLYSASSDLILPGITRKYVLQIAEKLKIRVNTQNIKLERLPEFEAAFICGTSPKVLPVKQIDAVRFDPSHPLIAKIIDAYEIIFQSQFRNPAPD